MSWPHLEQLVLILARKMVSILLRGNVLIWLQVTSKMITISNYWSILPLPVVSKTQEQRAAARLVPFIRDSIY